MNFFKAYKDKVVDAPSYDDDYIYYLVERFIKEYIPMVIEKSIMESKTTKISIPFTDIEAYLKESMKEDIIKAINEEKIKTDDVDVYISKFTGYIPTALKQISELPFKSRVGELEMDLIGSIEYYYQQEQLDYVLRTLTPEEEQLKAQTRYIFREEIVLKFLPALIEACKAKRKKKVEIFYSYDKGIIKFGDLEFSGLDLEEFGKCIKSLPGRELTEYPRPTGIILYNKYCFQFGVQDLEDFYNQELLRYQQQETQLSR